MNPNTTPAPYPAIGPWQWPPDAPQPARFAQEAAAMLARGDGPGWAFATAQQQVATLAALLEHYADGEAQRVAGTGEIRVGAFGVPGARLRLAHLAHAMLAQVESILQELETAHLVPASRSSTAAAANWNAELDAAQAGRVPWNA